MPGQGQRGIHSIAGRGEVPQPTAVFRSSASPPGDSALLPGAGTNRAGVREPRGPEATKMSGPSVLVIDDDLENRATVREILELDSYRVTEAASVTEALEQGDWPEFLA